MIEETKTLSDQLRREALTRAGIMNSLHDRIIHGEEFEKFWQMQDSALARVAELEKESAEQKQDKQEALRLLSIEMTETDSYGVPGSDLYRCVLCGGESRAGIMNKGINHEEGCILDHVKDHRVGESLRSIAKRLKEAEANEAESKYNESVLEQLRSDLMASIEETAATFRSYNAVVADLSQLRAQLEEQKREPELREGLLKTSNGLIEFMQQERTRLNAENDQLRADLARAEGDEKRLDYLQNMTIKNHLLWLKSDGYRENGKYFTLIDRVDPLRYRGDFETVREAIDAAMSAKGETK